MKKRKKWSKQFMASVLVIVMLVTVLPMYQGKEAKAATGSDVVSYARNFLGYSYVYGTAGPNTFDCSGLVKYVFQQFGITLPHSSNAIYNSPGSYGTVVSEANAQPGDLVSWSGHIGIYIGDGNVINALNATAGVCITAITSFISNGQQNPPHKFIRVNGITGSASADSGTTATVSYGNITTEFVDTWNAGLYGEINNSSRATVSVVGAYVWDSNGTLVVNHTENCGLSNSTIYQRLNIVSEALPGGLRSGETYTYQLFAQANGATYYSGKANFTVVDSEKPVITDAKIANVTSEGYTVTCRATDNYQIDRVQFPTWTQYQEQDDLASEWWNSVSCSGTRNGDTFTFYVKRSDHNNEYGVYLTHIYAYDKAGNWDVVNLETEITETTTPTSTPTPEETVSTPSPEQSIGTPTPTPKEDTTEPTPTPKEDTTEPTPTPKEDTAEPTPIPKEDITEQTPTAKKADLSATTAKASIAKVAGITAKNKKGKILRCTWKKANNAWAYQVQVAKNRSFTKGKKTSTSYQTNTSIYGMKKKQTYYVRVRGYDYVDGKKVYGQWSVIKKVKIKK